MSQKLSYQSITALQARQTPYEVCDSVVSGLRIRVQPSGIKTYLFSYRNAQGTRRRLTIGRFPSIPPAQARQEARKAVGTVATGRDPHQEKADIRRTTHAASLDDFLTKQYGPWVEANRRSGAITAKRIRSAFKSLLGKPLLGLTPLAIDDWRTARVRNGISPVTINREIAALKALLSAAVRWQAISQNPLSSVKLSGGESERIVRYLTAEEEKRLRAALHAREARHRAKRDSANKWRGERGYTLLPDLRPVEYSDHLQPMVLLSINTGLRRGELFKVLWRDVKLNVALSVLTVRAAAAKGGRSRQIPLNREAAEVLKTWKSQFGSINPEALIFAGREGEQFNNTKRSWERLLKDANIQQFRWHDMRHHFASRLVMAGVDLNTVRELLGHGDLKMTLRYAHLAPEHKAAAVEKLMIVQAD